MAAARESRSWRTLLKNHKIFQQLKDFRAKESYGAECTCILAVHDGVLFVWNSESRCLMSTSLTALLSSATGFYSDQSQSTLSGSTGYSTLTSSIQVILVILKVQLIITRSFILSLHFKWLILIFCHIALIKLMEKLGSQ